MRCEMGEVKSKLKLNNDMVYLEKFILEPQITQSTRYRQGKTNQTRKQKA